MDRECPTIYGLMGETKGGDQLHDAGYSIRMDVFIAPVCRTTFLKHIEIQQQAFSSPCNSDKSDNIISNNNGVEIK